MPEKSVCWPNDPDYLDGKTEIELPSEHYTKVRRSPGRREGGSQLTGRVMHYGVWQRACGIRQRRPATLAPVLCIV